MRPSDLAPPDPWAALRRHTPARIALGRAGTSVPTAEWLRFAAAHATARDAVRVPLDVAALAAQLRADGWPSAVVVTSRAPSREAYLRRPDWGRRLDDASALRLRDAAGAPVDVAIVVGDGLSATGVQRHAPALLQALRDELAGELSVAPPVIATQARVALVVLGERPGLSAPETASAPTRRSSRVSAAATPSATASATSAPTGWRGPRRPGASRGCCARRCAGA